MSHGSTGSRRTYFAVFAALLLLTVVTVLVSYVDLGLLNVVVALFIASVKASLVAPFFLFALAANRFRKYEGAARAVPVVAILLLLTEIGMGGAVVLLETPVRLTTIHFMIGLLVFLLAFFMMTFDGERERPAFASRGPAALFLSVAALVYSQSALGAYVRHLEAGLACPDFPTCLGTWFPPLFADTVLAHFSHRTLGYLVLLTAGMVYLFVRRDPRQRGNSPLALAHLWAN